MKSFESLDRQSQREQLGQLGQAALAEYGIDQARLQFISDSENTVFQIKTPSQSYALRIHSADEKPASEVEGELHWLAALRSETALRVPTPVPTSEGKLVLEINRLGMSSPIPMVLFHWMPGQTLGEQINTDMMIRVGIMMGQLHNHAEHFVLPAHISRIPWEKKRGETLKGYLRSCAGLTDAEFAFCISAAEQSGVEIEKIDESHYYGLIHCDIHPWNCLIHQGEIGLIDFDDCRPGSFVEDIAITLTYFDERPDYKSVRTAFFEGYTQIRPLPPNYRTEVEAFMVSRGLNLINWVLGWPSPDLYPFGPDILASGLRRAERYITKAG